MLGFGVFAAFALWIIIGGEMEQLPATTGIQISPWHMRVSADSERPSII